MPVFANKTDTCHLNDLWATMCHFKSWHKKAEASVPMVAVRNMYHLPLWVNTTAPLLVAYGDQKGVIEVIKRSWPLEKTRQTWTITATVTASLSWWLNKELGFIKLGSSLRLKGPFPDPPILKKTNSISTFCWETQMGVEKQCCQPLSPSMVNDLLTCHPMILYLILAIINCISPEALRCLTSVLI